MRLLDNPLTALSELNRACKDGGMLIIPTYMDAFLQKLKAEGYEEVRLLDTTDGTFMGKKEASWLGLAGSALLAGKK